MADTPCEPTMFLRHAESLLTSARRDQLLLEYPLIRDQAHFAESHWAEQLRVSAQHLSGISSGPFDRETSMQTGMWPMSAEHVLWPDGLASTWQSSSRTR